MSTIRTSAGDALVADYGRGDWRVVANPVNRVSAAQAEAISDLIGSEDGPDVTYVNASDVRLFGHLPGELYVEFSDGTMVFMDEDGEVYSPEEV